MAEEVKAEGAPKKKRKLSLKAVGIVTAVVVVLVAVCIGVVWFMRWKNDGARYAKSLSEQIGVSPETAQKYAHLTLDTASQFACINMAAEDYKYLYESKKTVQVSGVSIPQWVIYVGEDDNIVTDVQYYQYTQLQDYGNGVKVQAHVDVPGITIGMSQEGVHQYVGFAPLCVSYTSEGMREAYKYYYKDQNTGNTVSYVLYVTYEDGVVSEVSEVENQFILSVLTVK